MKHKRKLRNFSRTFLIPAIGEQRKESKNAYTNNKEKAMPTGGCLSAGGLIASLI